MFTIYLQRLCFIGCLSFAYLLDKIHMNFLYLDQSVLAAWFRLKYPHIAMGALASSAPLLYFDDITPSDGFHSVVSDNFRVRIKGVLLYFE